MISASPNSIHEAITSFGHSHENTSIITTNYDGCMDEAILRRRTTRKSKGTSSAPDSLEPIKMHGSISWAYCDSCQDVREFDLLQLKESYETDTLSYPVLGICRNCGGLRRPLLVPPLSLKFLTFPNLIEVWNTARLRIEDADYLIVVGYSFSESDAYVAKIISRSMSTKEKQLMIVVNTDGALAPTLRERFAVHIEGFDHTRILAVSGKEEELLPTILEDMLDTHVDKRPKKRRAKGKPNKQSSVS